MLLDFIRGWAFDPKKECFVPHKHAVQHIHSRSNSLLYLAFSRFFFFSFFGLFTLWHLSMSQFPPTSRTCNPYVFPTPSLSSARCPAGLTHWEVMHCGMLTPPPPLPAPESHPILPHHRLLIWEWDYRGLWVRGIERLKHIWHPFLLSSGVKPAVQLRRRPLEWTLTEKTEEVNRENKRKLEKRFQNNTKKCKFEAFSEVVETLLTLSQSPQLRKQNIF